VQQTSFPEEERTAIVVHAEKPLEFTLRVRAPHWAKGIALTLNGRAENAAAGNDGYIALSRTWKSGDRVEVTLPMTLREEPVAGSPELASLAYGPLVLAAGMGRDGLSSEMIDGPGRAEMDRLPALAMPRFEAGHEAGSGIAWVRKSDEGELRFRTVNQEREFALKPLYQVMDERYSVYWQRQPKA
jgi:DUF1680 family protein